MKDSHYATIFLQWILYKYTYINPLAPNVPYSGCTAPLNSKVAFYLFIQQI